MVNNHFLNTFPVCFYLIENLQWNIATVSAAYYPLLGVLCTHESNELLPDLAASCTTALACLSTAILTPDVMAACLESVSDIVGAGVGASWKAKCAALEFLQVAAFTNMPLVMNKPKMLETVLAIVVDVGLECDRVEVRLKAGEVLSGLVHCSFVSGDKREKLKVYISIGPTT